MTGLPMDAGADEFEAWARRAVQRASVTVLRHLREVGVAAEAGGEGGPKSTGAGYRSHYVMWVSTKLGPLAVWLYAVPAGHEYGTSTGHAQTAAGLMYHSNRAVEKDVLSYGRLGTGNTFRWRTLKAGWEGYALLREAQPPIDSDAAGDELARAVIQGLGASGLDR
jgi:hypothetical protein